MKKNFRLILLMGLAGCAGIGSKNEKSGFPITKTVLDNGLTLIVSPNHRLPIVSYYTLYDVGGRYEGPGTTGATHFLEHMMFGSTTTHGANDFDQLIERSGGKSNAFTTQDATVYYESVPANFLPKIMELESDRMVHLKLEPAAFESERQVVFEERKMRYENSPSGLLHLMMMKKMFEGTPYGTSVIGDVKDLTDLSRQQMMEFYETFYKPNNAVIAVVGDVDTDQTIAMFKEKYSAIQPSKDLSELKLRRDHEKNFILTEPKEKIIKLHSNNPLGHFLLAFPGYKWGAREGYMAELVSHILSKGESSYFNLKYIKSNNPLLQSLEANNYNLRYNGVYYLEGELLTKDENEENIRKKLLADKANFCTEAINAQSLKSAQNNFEKMAYERIDTNSGVAQTLVENQNIFKDPNYGVVEMNIYLTATVEEATKVCQEIFAKDPLFVIAGEKY